MNSQHMHIQQELSVTDCEMGIGMDYRTKASGRVYGEADPERLERGESSRRFGDGERFGGELVRERLKKK